MFDYHMHTTVSFDAKDDARAMLAAAEAKGLKEICFTDHIDYTPAMDMVFDTAVYKAAYDDLRSDKLLIRRGMEFGLTPDNQAQLKEDLKRYDFDFVIGSVHLVDGLDVYLEPYWEGKTQQEAIERFLEQTLRCVQVHEDYDVLGHLTFISKARGNPRQELIPYESHRELFEEILKELVRHDKGLEVNTSGVDRCGGYLPTMDFARRYHELGGRIVTVGSDAHDCSRVGQYANEAVAELKEIFGYVCTFEKRQPIFHK